MVKSYTFIEKNDFSKKGINVVSAYLSLIKKTISVKNVEDNPNYQKNDIDLVWVYKKEDKQLMISIEVKTDKSQLSKVQKQIKDIVNKTNSDKISFHTFEFKTNEEE